MSDPALLPVWPLLAAALGFLTPWAVGALASADDARRPTGPLPLIAVLIALAAYAATGFALHFGGIGILIDHPDVAGLVWEWTPLRQGNLALWGVAGWAGFGMRDAQTPLAALLFLSALPLAATASLLAMLTLWRQVSAAAGVFFTALMALALVPLVGNWTQADGWLMHLGESIGAGNGYLDFGGASFFLLAGGVALAVLLLTRGPQPEEQAAWDKRPVWGAGLLGVGGIGWIIASPLHLWSGSTPMQAVLNALLAMSAGGLIGLAYGWFLQGAPAPRWLLRGAAAGWVASLAAIVWMTPLQAMLVGAMAAWLFILTAWSVNELLGWYDPGDIFATFGLPAAWGVLAVGFFAPASGQFKAQIIGVAAIFLLAFFTASIFGALFMLARREASPETEPDAVSPES